MKTTPMKTLKYSIVACIACGLLVGCQTPEERAMSQMERQMDTQMKMLERMQKKMETMDKKMDALDE
jgi:hypothetical protein